MTLPLLLPGFIELRLGEGDDASSISISSVDFSLDGGGGEFGGKGGCPAGGDQHSGGDGGRPGYWGMLSGRRRRPGGVIGAEGDVAPLGYRGKLSGLEPSAVNIDNRLSVRDLFQYKREDKGESAKINKNVGNEMPRKTNLEGENFHAKNYRISQTLLASR